MITRRRFLGSAIAIPAVPLGGTALRAQDRYPSRNITMIVPYPPGGQADFAGRPIAQALEKVLGRTVIVDNRGGAGGAIGNAAAARSTPDGYTHPDRPAGARRAAGGGSAVRAHAGL